MTKMKRGNFIAEVIVTIVQIFNTSIGIRANSSKVEFYVTKPKETRSIDSRLEGIDHAKESLLDALNALESLKSEAEKNKSELKDITAHLSQASQDKEDLTSQIAEIRKLAQIDAGTVRGALGIPSVRQLWVNRVAGFIFGIVASVIASLIMAMF